MRWVKPFFVSVILLVSPFAVNAATGQGGSLFLMLDRGFVGRPVELAVFENRLVVAWDAGTLISPSNLTMKLDGDNVHLVFDDASALSASGSIRVTLDGTPTSVSASHDIVLSRDDFEAAAPDTAQPGTSNTVTPTDETLLLTLDSGFVARPVSLDVFGGEVTVSWDARALVKPTTLRLTRTHGGFTSEQKEAGLGLDVRFGSPDAVSADGKVTVRMKALRPPQASEQPEVNVEAGDTRTLAAKFVGESIFASDAAKAAAVYAPAYRDGIMRSGMASWYKYKNCLCAASPDVPKGTKLRVARADDPSRYTIVTVNDYGPDRSIFPERVIDLDYVAFSAIGNPRGGVLSVTVDLVKPEEPLFAYVGGSSP